MKQLITIILISVALLTQGATTLPAGLVEDVRAERSERNLIVKMRIDPSVADARSDRELWLRPYVTDGRDSLWLEPVVIAGRTRYYLHLRRDGKNPEYIMLRSGKGEPYDYTAIVDYADWMEMSSVQLVSQTDGCCGEAAGPQGHDELAVLDSRPKVYEPVLAYVTPAREAVKAREVHGSAYIDFPVNSTEILPAYRDNLRELSKIQATVDAVRDDRDVSITSLDIKGYASPEGSYANNERLARGRTEALAAYVRRLYDFPAALMHTSWEAEDWAGLERWIAGHDMADKEGILAIVTDAAVAPDRREQMLKSRYPEQYAMLLAEVYPSLRHSDYTVNYTVRQYADVAEIAAVMAVSPQKLSLDELFRLARSYDSSSPEFMEVMEVAVRMFPDSETANLNAALTAASHGESAKARRYLQRAGDSADAAYAAGVVEACDGNYAEALMHFERALAGGVAEAAGEIEKLRRLGLPQE